MITGGRSGGFRTVALLCACAAVLLSAGAQTDSEQRPYKPVSEYEKRQVEGWTVYVEKSLPEQHADLAGRTLRILGNHLFDIKRVVPTKAVADLQEVPIWVQYRHKDMKCAAYHPSRQWLTEHGYNPVKAGSVDIGNAGNFITWTEDQWWMVLHELAHAYHHRELGFDNPEVKENYERVKKAGLYDEVRHWRGGAKRHYALKNHKEYFAEMTEAYFGVNDFYPFVRAELKECDPETVGLLEKLWGVN